jgi:predicted chitinase
MSKLADILKNEYKSKGIVTGAASAIGKKSLEKLDIRNALFGGSGIGSVLGRKIFGKGYSATSSKITPTSSIQSSQTSGVDNALLQAINQNATITAKNTMGIPMMARDMNVMRQNVVKLVKLQGGTPSTKADMFFSKAKEREAMYESAMEKNKPTKLGQKANDDPDKKGFIGKLLEYGTFLFAGLKAILSKIPDMLSSVVGGALKTIMNIFSIDNIIKVMGIAKDALTSIFKIAGMVASSPIFLALAGATSVAMLLNYLRGDYGDKKDEYQNLAQKKKDTGSLSEPEEKRLRELDNPAIRSATTKDLNYDPIENKETVELKPGQIANENRAKSLKQLQPGTAKEYLAQGEEFYKSEGYTKEQLEKFAAGKKVIAPPTKPTAPTKITQNVADNLSNIRQALIDKGITDEKYITAVQANVMKESGGITKSENIDYSNTSNERIRNIFKSATKGKTDSEINEMKSSPEKMANSVYGGKMGNTEPGDGWKYRGRGFIQLTGKDNYKSASKDIFGDDRLLQNPELANDPQVATQVTAWFMKKGKAGMISRMGLNGQSLTQKEANLLATSQIAGRDVRKSSDYLKGEVLAKVSKFQEQLTTQNNKGTVLAQTSTDVKSTRDLALANKPETIVVNTPSSAPQVSGMGGGTITMASVTDDEFARRVLNYVGA